MKFNPNDRNSRSQRKDHPKQPPIAAAPPGQRTDWGDVAEWYDQHVGEAGSEYQREVVLPGVLRLLALQPGQKAVDVACGQGVLCRLLHERGVNVTGLDAAAPLIRAAKERGPEEIRYHVADARDLLFMPARQFQAAALVLSVQNLNPLPPVFAGIARLLVPWGRLVVVMMHPCFRGPKETSWGWDEAGKIQYRRVDRYLLPRKVPIITHPGRLASGRIDTTGKAAGANSANSAKGEGTGTYTWSFHKPLESYVKALRNAGLLVDALEEWPSHKTSEPGPRGAAENTARKEIPMFLALRAVRIPKPTADPTHVGESSDESDSSDSSGALDSLNSSESVE